MTTSFPTPRPGLLRLLQRWRSSWWPERRRSAWWGYNGRPRSRWCWCGRSHPAWCWGWWRYSQYCCPCSPGGWSPRSLGGTGTLRRNRNIRTMRVFFLFIRCTSAVSVLVFVSLRELTCSRCEADAVVWRAGLVMLTHAFPQQVKGALVADHGIHWNRHQPTWAAVQPKLNLNWNKTLNFYFERVF